MFTRRTFLSTAVTVAAFGMAFPAFAAELPVEKITADVVVVGAGGTGMAAAASAAEHGAKVVVFEKMAMIGGSSALSGGAIAAGDTKWLKANHENLPADGYAKIWLEDQKLSVPGGAPEYPNREAVYSLTREFTKTVDWIQETIGHTYAKPRPFGWGGPNYAHAPAQMAVPPSGRGSLAGGGVHVIAAFKKYCDKLGVKLYTMTPVKEIRTNDKGEVSGVVAESKKVRYEVDAKAVILASGGFARSAKMVEERVPAYAPFVKYSVAAMGDTGDGIVMAKKVGAVEPKDSWMIGLFFTASDPKLGGTFTTKQGYKNCVFINEKGERFVKEDLSYVTDMVAAQKAAWAIVDSSDPEKVKPLAGLKDPAVAVSGNTWAELAKNLGVDAKNLESTMAAYNKAAETKKDEAFGKDPEYILPFAKAPFYAVRIVPQTGGTMGGVNVDDKFRVLRADGSVIKGLYAGGEMANRKYYGRMYSSGSSLAIAYTSGRIAGEDAAKLAK